MTDEKMEEILFSISGKLAGIESKLDSLSESILKHESRLTTLENDFKNLCLQQKPDEKKDEDLKSELLKLLAKALVVGLTATASLAGAGGLVAKIFGH